MKKVAYILGAGFSAPLGVPVMRNFIDVARKIKRENPNYDYFNDVIKMAQNTMSVSGFFQHDSTNIEEALSLLEMRDNLGAVTKKDDLIKFICEVIKKSTPEIPPKLDPSKIARQSWYDIFSNNQVWQGYCSFVASLFHLQFYQGSEYSQQGIDVKRIYDETEYSILSLNYDMILENVCEFINQSFYWEPGKTIQFRKSTDNETDQKRPWLVKIHGSIDKGDIIPPTFNKGLYGSQLPQSWQDAYEIIHHANEIRVLGYSLPQTDSYIKYLLMASVDQFSDLDHIDWIVRDSNGEVHDRFEKFIKFKNKRFVKADIKNYLSAIFGSVTNKVHNRSDRATFNELENVHDGFMSQDPQKLF